MPSTLRTKPGVASLADLVRSTLRLRPDRIIVGEVKAPKPSTCCKAWNTGHPGGIATVHANSARAALYRIEQVIQEAVATVPRRLIAEAIDLVVFIKGRGRAPHRGESPSSRALILPVIISWRPHLASQIRPIVPEPDGEYDMLVLLRSAARCRLLQSA